MLKALRSSPIIHEIFKILANARGKYPLGTYTEQRNIEQRIYGGANNATKTCANSAYVRALYVCLTRKRANPVCTETGKIHRPRADYTLATAQTLCTTAKACAHLTRQDCVRVFCVAAMIIDRSGGSRGVPRTRGAISRARQMAKKAGDEERKTNTDADTRAHTTKIGYHNEGSVCVCVCVEIWAYADR